MQAPAFARAVPWILLAVGCAAASDAPENDASSTTQADADEASTAEPEVTGTTAPSDPASSDASTSSNTTASTTAPTDDTTTDTTASADTTTIDPDVGSPVDQLPPTDGAALLPWLQSGEYLAWTAESGIHESAGPHGGDVRTFVNDALFDSLAAGADAHPVDAAAVKELYYDGDDVVGWAVLVKVAPGEGGDNWYWYERVGASVYADGTGVPLCFECHEIGIDQVRTPFPLQ